MVYNTQVQTVAAHVFLLKLLTPQSANKTTPVSLYCYLIPSDAGFFCNKYAGHPWFLTALPWNISTEFKTVRIGGTLLINIQLIHYKNTS